jgi:hypothetical protein
MGPKKGIALILGAPEGGESDRPGHGSTSREGLRVALKDFFSAAQSDNWDEATAAFVDAMKLVDVDEEDSEGEM